jgi:hypothetical protein
MDELDPAMVDDVNREIKFMKAIRHPHILLFYGGGIAQQTNKVCLRG